MCTLTWLHAAAGYRLWFNRDELLTRGQELPPAVTETERCRYIAPSDTDQGGTWIATNDRGITITLLNGYRSSRGQERDSWTSRGKLVRELAETRDSSDFWHRLAPSRLAEYRPCVVVFIAPEEQAIVARWDGLDLVLDPRGGRQLPVTSSSFAQDEVQVSRRELYARTVLDAGGATPERLEAFQCATGEDGPDAYSPSMRRDDAGTRSQCRIEVDAREVRFVYVPGPPHATEPRPPLVLARRRR